MNRLTAIRTFSNSRYTPVKTRIYKNKWYLCTFQNVESDPMHDYHGLAEGEYTELLPGNEARRARDAHLNHLNSLREHTGQVWTVSDPQRCNNVTYHHNQAAAAAKVATIIARNQRDLAAAIASIDQQLSRSDADIIKVFGKCSDWNGVDDWKLDVENRRQPNMDYYAKQPTVTRIK